MLVEKVLQLLVCKVDAELLKRVVLKVLKPKDVQNPYTHKHMRIPIQIHRSTQEKNMLGMKAFKASSQLVGKPINIKGQEEKTARKT